MVFNKRKYSPLLMRGGGALDGVLTQVNNATGIVKPLVSEVFRLMPDGVLFGSAFFALVSQSFPMAMFVVSMIEASLVGIALQKLMSFVDLASTLPTLSDDPSKCMPTTFAPSLESVMNFSRNSISSAFPSFPIWFMSTASAYIVGSMWSQTQELQALGPEYAARFYIAIAVTTLLLFATISYRLAYACDGVGILLVTAILGLVMGGLLAYQNLYLLGRDSLNFSGVPLLVERTKDGKPLYVCTTKGVA